MTEVFSDEVTTSSPDKTKKQRKKQAKREARTMLKLGKAKEDMQKRELKLAKAELRLEAAVAQVQILEAKLAEMQISQAETESELEASEEDRLRMGLNGQQESESYVASIIEQEAVLSEVERWAESTQEQESLLSEESQEPQEASGLGEGEEITTDTLGSAHSAEETPKPHTRRRSSGRSKPRTDKPKP